MTEWETCKECGFGEGEKCTISDVTIEACPSLRAEAEAKLAEKDRLLAHEAKPVWDLVDEVKALRAKLAAAEKLAGADIVDVVCQANKQDAGRLARIASLEAENKRLSAELASLKSWFQALRRVDLDDEGARDGAPSEEER